MKPPSSPLPSSPSPPLPPPENAELCKVGSRQVGGPFDVSLPLWTSGGGPGLGVGTVRDSGWGRSGTRGGGGTGLGVGAVRDSGWGRSGTRGGGGTGLGVGAEKKRRNCQLYLQNCLYWELKDVFVLIINKCSFGNVRMPLY